MSAILFILLCVFFGYVFSTRNNEKMEQLQSQLDHEKEMRKRESENHTLVVNKLTATIREML